MTVEAETFDPQALVEARHHHEPVSQRAEHPVAIDVKGVTKVFETSEQQKTVALQDVSFQIRVGEFVSLRAVGHLGQVVEDAGSMACVPGVDEFAEDLVGGAHVSYSSLSFARSFMPRERRW